MSEKHAAPDRKFRWFYALIAAVFILAVAEAVYEYTQARTSGAVFSGSPPNTQHFPAQGHVHNLQLVKTFHYNSNPPTSGPHAEVYPPAVVNLRPIDTAALVHMLEHGNIVVTYHQLPQDELDRLTKWVDVKNPPDADKKLQEYAEAGKLVFLCPWDSLASGHIDALAWTRLYDTDHFDFKRLDAFVKAWQHNLENMNQ